MRIKLRLMGGKKDQFALSNWCASKTAPKIAKEFPYIWTRNQSWEKFPPTIACIGKRIVGFHATAYTATTGYCNLYYVAVDKQFQGKGIGSRLIEDALERGRSLGMTRWTNKSHIGSEGEKYFSEHLGITPIGEQGDQVVYDWSIAGVESCQDIQEATEKDMNGLLRLKGIPERKLKQYKKSLTKVLQPIFGKEQVKKTPRPSTAAIAGFVPSPSGSIRRFPRVGRFPRYPKRFSRIINIRGTNGSGKSTIVYEIMKKFGRVAYNDKKTGKTWAYRIPQPHSKRRLYVLGRYTTACGGCDTFVTKNGVKGVDLVSEGLRKLSKLGDVIFEGIIVSGVAGRWVDLAHELEEAHFIFGVLDTPLETCIKRVKTRRKARGTTKPFNPKNLSEKYKSTHSCGRFLERAGMDVRQLDHKRAVETVLEWLAHP